MIDFDRQMLKGAIDARLNTVFNNLQSNPEYQACKERQEKSEAAVTEILNKLNKSDRLVVRRHYEGETELESIVIFEAYLQGLRDGFKLLVFLDIFRPEIFF